MSSSKDRIKELLHHKDVLLDYLQCKVREEDYHGVADCAMDLRDIEAELKGLKYHE